jgi:hypothetical protein
MVINLRMSWAVPNRFNKCCDNLASPKHFVHYRITLNHPHMSIQRSHQFVYVVIASHNPTATYCDVVKNGTNVDDVMLTLRVWELHLISSMCLISPGWLGFSSGKWFSLSTNHGIYSLACNGHVV